MKTINSTVKLVKRKLFDFPQENYFGSRFFVIENKVPLRVNSDMEPDPNGKPVLVSLAVEDGAPIDGFLADVWGLYYSREGELLVVAPTGRAINLKNGLRAKKRG